MMDCLLPGLSIAGFCWKLNGSRPGLNAFVKLSCPVSLWRWNLKFQSNHFLMWTFDFWLDVAGRPQELSPKWKDEYFLFSNTSNTSRIFSKILSPPRKMVPCPGGSPNGQVMQLPQVPAAVFEAWHPGKRQRIGMSWGYTDWEHDCLTNIRGYIENYIEATMIFG